MQTTIAGIAALLAGFMAALWAMYKFEAMVTAAHHRRIQRMLDRLEQAEDGGNTSNEELFQ